MATEKEIQDTLASVGRRKNALLFIIALIIVVLGVPIALSLRTIIDTQDYLKECTTPSESEDFHECYESGQMRTGEALKALFSNQANNRDAIICVLLLPPRDRTGQTVATCSEQAEERNEDG